MLPSHLFIYYYYKEKAIQLVINFILRFFDVKIKFDTLYLIINVFTNEYEIKTYDNSDCDLYFKGSQINLVEYDVRARKSECLGFDVNHVYYKIKYPKVMKNIIKMDIKYYLDNYKKYTHMYQ